MVSGVSRDSIQRNVLGELYGLMNFPTPTTKCNETQVYGRRLYFIGANNEGSVRRVQGCTLAGAYIDEAACLPHTFWKMIQSRLRVPNAQLLATCNPEGPAHWLKKEFIDRAHELDLRHWTFQLDDNPSLDEKYKNAIKKEYTGMWYKRYILGEWAAAHGLIFDAYDYDNVYEHPRNNPNYYICGVDYGTSNATAAVLIACCPKMWPQMCVESEYYYDSVLKGRSKNDAELADDIQKFVGYKSVQAVYVDPSAASLKIELRARNLPVLDAKNDILPGLKIVSKFIAGKNLVIHKSCKYLNEYIQSYCWDPKAADRGEDKPLKEKEHIIDALRYAVYSKYPSGEFDHPDETKSIDQIRREIYGTSDWGTFDQGGSTYA